MGVTQSDVVSHEISHYDFLSLLQVIVELVQHYVDMVSMAMPEYTSNLEIVSDGLDTYIVHTVPRAHSDGVSS